MKLLEKTGRYFLFSSTLVIILGGIGIYFTLNYLLDHEMDEGLRHTRGVLREELLKRDSLPKTLQIMDEIVDIVPVLANDREREVFKDTLRLVLEEDETEFELEPFRQFSYVEDIRGSQYRISLHHSKFEREYLLLTIAGLIAGFLLLCLLLLNLFNRYQSQRLWRPFYQMIEQIKDFNFRRPNVLESHTSNIEEFAILNTAINQMTTKLLRDYLSLKRFTENASHEIQTPLAIISAQLEVLLQQKTEDERKLEYLHQIQQATFRLSKLNRSLLLLARIENRQFEEKKDIALREKIEAKLEDFQLLLSPKSLTYQIIGTDLEVQAHPDLIDILLNNLLTNAIKHNKVGGEIQIQLNEHQLSIRNTGAAPAVPVANLFGRFQKGDDASASVGLGLAIAKEICEVYDWKISYHYQQDWHELSILF